MPSFLLEINICFAAEKANSATLYLIPVCCGAVMLHQGNVFRFRQPGRAECGEISAGIWGFIHLLWSQSKHSLWFGGSLLNRMWEAFVFGVLFFFSPLCVCVLYVCVWQKDRKLALKNVWQYVCTQISMCSCVCLLSLTEKRIMFLKGFTTACQSQMGGAN